MIPTLFNVLALLALVQAWIPLQIRSSCVTTRWTVDLPWVVGSSHLKRTGSLLYVLDKNEVPYPYTEPIDPLLMGLLVRRNESGDEMETSNSYERGFSSVSIRNDSRGIQIWRMALRKGQLPSDTEPWPEEPLFSKMRETMAQLKLPRFVHRHPQTVSAVLLSIIRIVGEFRRRKKDIQSEATKIEERDEEEDDYEFDYFFNEEFGMKTDESNEPEISEEYLTDQLAREMVATLDAEWGDVVPNSRALDQLFGYDHDLMDDERGFGTQDGIWKHSGWSHLPSLMREAEQMKELNHLTDRLGRRPTAESKGNLEKFTPRKASRDGALGAEWDLSLRESISGLTLSGSLADMLPAEAVLLRGSSILRKLFFAKMAEEKLQSYHVSGWSDVPSVPVSRPRYKKRYPSAPGGPIVVCLDTSYSMSERREAMSKAVVLACVAAAHKQKRDCQVVAFSTERNTMDSGVLRADANGMRRLLEFLSCSFGGGTDVTGALKYATSDTKDLSSADLVLVTDGEIPDPPVSEETMNELDRLKCTTGMEIHGILVGRNESKSLSKICTEVHTFLQKYDGLGAVQRSGKHQRATQLAMHAGFPSKTFLLAPRFRSQSRSRTLLYARRSWDDYDDDFGGPAKSRKKRKKGKKGNRWDGDDHTEDEVQQTASSGDEIESGSSDYHIRVEEAVTRTLNESTDSVNKTEWRWKMLEDDRTRESVKSIECAIAMLSRGLVEREKEARLVLLSFFASEHIFLVGPPGTGKSVLGQRLSQLCGGKFFQRLLTRFTTPDELFGPLSLKSLEERDEYRRITDGFLPTASVAFLDEIFKANSSILNTLLTILNERKFDNGRGNQEDCALRCVVGASNELPESEEIDALYDRFLIRAEVLPVSDEGVTELLMIPDSGLDKVNDGEGNSLLDALDDDLLYSLQKSASLVELTDDVAALIRDLRIFLRGQSIEISDRRLVKAVRLLRISAASNGRRQVDLIDCMLLQHILWRLPEERKIIRDWLLDHLTPGGRTSSAEGMSMIGEIGQFRLLMNALRQEVTPILRETMGDLLGDSGARESDLIAIAALRDEAKKISDILNQRCGSLRRHIALLEQQQNPNRVHLWLGDEAQQLSSMLPRSRTVLNEATTALVECRAMVIVLSPEENNKLENDIRLDALSSLWDDNYDPSLNFTTEELKIDPKQAKIKYDGDTFRKWKQERRKAGVGGD